jgi:pyruvate kinase
MLDQAIEIAKDAGISKQGDAVVITAGSPNGLAKGANTNLIKVERIK